MNRHLVDADLVALALMPEDETPDARIHLASCSSCAARLDLALDQIDRHRRDHERSVESRDATFWKRQELAIMRDVGRAGHPAAARRSLVAAAIVTVAIGGFWFGRSSVEPFAPTVTSPSSIATGVSPDVTGTSSGLVPAAAVSTNPWESESLSGFQAVVDWESWVDDDQKDQGTI